MISLIDQAVGTLYSGSLQMFSSSSFIALFSQKSAGMLSYLEVLFSGIVLTTAVSNTTNKGNGC